MTKHIPLTPNQRKAIERRQAALAKRAATPKSEPRPEPIRLGEHVTLQHRVIAGPPFTEQLRALGKRAKR